MRKMKKINGYLVVRFNDREKRGYPTLGSFGVIDAELYTGHIDVDIGAFEYIDADAIEVAVEQARGLNAEEDYSDEPPVYTVTAETAEEVREEEVEPGLLLRNWEEQLKTQIKSSHYPDIDFRTAVHELNGYKAALRDLGLTDEDDEGVAPDYFDPGEGVALPLVIPEKPLAHPPEKDTFENLESPLKHSSTMKNVYALGVMLGEDCPGNDCIIYRNIFKMALELDEAIGKVGDHAARILRSMLRKHVQELREMYDENFAVQQYKGGLENTSIDPKQTQKEIGPPDKQTAPRETLSPYRPPIEAIGRAKERAREGHMDYAATALTRAHDGASQQP